MNYKKVLSRVKIRAYGEDTKGYKKIEFGYLLGATIGIILNISVSNAQEKTAPQGFLQTTTFGGYVIGKAAISDQDIDTAINPSNASHLNFDIRLIRLYVDGKMKDFTYRLQGEMTAIGNNSTPTTEKTPHIVDAWIEWHKYPFAKIRFGEFKRAISFENQYNPYNIGFYAPAQIILKLTGFSDRVGEHASAGRDLGIQLQGSFLPHKSKTHDWLHYQLGIYNGQGINSIDNNKTKDVIGGIWVKPIQHLNIGAFGWAGNFTLNGITVNRNRMALGVKYENRWIFRAEYITSQGHKISDYNAETKLLKPTAIRPHADGWYVALGIPIVNKFKLYTKWDVYRDDKTNNTRKSTYHLVGNYSINKNLLLQLNYYFTEDVAHKIDRYYNTVDLQAYWRF